MNASFTRNARCPLMALLLALPLSGFAADPGTIVIDCAAPVLPSQQLVSNVLEKYNLGQAYAARTRLWIQASRDCQRPGVEQILISANRGRDADVRPLVAVALPR